MPSVNLYVNKDHGVTNAPGNYGNSKDDHAPVGYVSSSGWRYRYLLKFPLADVPSGAKIVRCTLYLKQTSYVHMGEASPRIKIRRLSENFAATGGSGETWQTGADPAGFGTGSFGEVSYPGFPSGSGNINGFDVTDQLEAVLRPAVLKRDGTPCGDATWHGFEVRAFDESTSGDRVEFHSTRGSYTPRVNVEYTMEAAPGHPTQDSPVGAQASVPTALVFTFPAGDTAVTAKITVGSLVPGSIDLWNPGSFPVTPGAPTSIPYAGLPIAPGSGNVYWSVQGRNSVDEWGSIATTSFYVLALPVVSVNSPTAGQPAHVHNLAEEVLWTGAEAKARVSCHYTHPSALASTDWEVRVDGSTVHAFTGAAGTVASGGDIDLDLPTAWARNVAKTIEVRAKAGGVWSNWTAIRTTRVNWSQAAWGVTGGGASTSDLRAVHAALSGGAKTQSAFLYRKTTGGIGTGNPWRANISDIVLTDGGFDVLVRLSTSDTAQPPAQPDIAVTYAVVPPASPDFWVATNAGIFMDPGYRRLGVHSMRVRPTAVGNLRNDRVLQVSKQSKYTLSAYVHTQGFTLSPALQLGILGSSGVELTAPNGRAALGSAGSAAQTTGAIDDWERIWFTFDTGANEFIIPCLFFGGTQEFWVDAFQLEEGGVATGWKPGMAGPAVVVDVGGIAVDGQAGGIFRLRTLDNNIIELRHDALYHDGVPIIPGGGGGGGVTDHGLLTGLADNDHPQYALDSEVASIADASVAGHAAAADPHPTYAKDTDLHAQAHAISGADHTGTLADAQIPATIARDTEVTAAVTAHEALADPHTGYLTETAHGGTSPTGHHAQAHVLTGADHTASGLTAGHVLRATSATAFAFGAIADADIPATIARDSEVSGAVTTHEAAADPHTAYQRESEKGIASGYASLDSGILVPVAQMGTGTADTTKFLRGDRTWQVPPGGAGGSLTDHTHAVAGSGATGGGGALAPTSLILPTGGVAPTVAGQVRYTPTYIEMGDGTTTKQVGTLSDTAASTQAFADAAAAGTSPSASRRDHKHAMPVDPVTAHAAAADPHPGYLTPAEGNAAYATTGHAHTPTPIKRTVIAATGSWSKTGSPHTVDVEVQAGGGGSGGVPATASGTMAAAGGGAGGNYVRKRYDGSALSGSYTVTVGTGGAGAAAGNNAGVAGNPSSFAGAGITTLTATGGPAGNGSTATGTGTLGTGGLVSVFDTGGDLNIPGGDGGTGVVAGGSRVPTGFGGSSVLGTSARASSNGVGQPGHAYGGGAAGAVSDVSQAAKVGGVGANGVVIVTEYY